MTPAELGRFVRTVVPHHRATAKLPLTRELIDALDAAMVLIGRAERYLSKEECNCGGWLLKNKHAESCVVTTAATLRLVLGEGGEGEK